MKVTSPGRFPYLTFAYRDPIDLPRLTFTELGERLGVFLPHPEPRTFTRCRPEFIDNPDRVSGFEDTHEATVHYPPPFIASATNAMVLGYRTIATSSGTLFTDDSFSPDRRQDFITRISDTSDSFKNEDTGLWFDGDKERFSLLSAEAETFDLQDRVVLLSSFEPSNYGSFLFRVLPKLISIRRWPREDYRFLCYPLSQGALDLLQALGVTQDRLVHHNPRCRYRANKIIAPSQRNNQAFLDPETRDLYSSLRERFGTSSVPGQAIYVSRAKFNRSSTATRHMENEEELIDALKDLGVEIVSPEKLQVSEQIAVFSSARLVIGPSGSGMFNVVFCQPDTHVLDIESEPWWLHAHMCLFSSLKLRYGIFVGRPADDDDRAVHRRWRVNVASVSDRVKAIMQEPSFMAG